MRRFKHAGTYHASATHITPRVTDLLVHARHVSASQVVHAVRCRQQSGAPRYIYFFSEAPRRLATLALISATAEVTVRRSSAISDCSASSLVS
eukprot:4306288-Prymnesium_polylepis.1